MESIGKIITEMTDQLSPQAADCEVTSERKITYTFAEAKGSGLKIMHKPPLPKKCKFCGETLHHEGVCLNDTIIVWHPSPQRCNCSKSLKYWEQHDAEQLPKKC